MKDFYSCICTILITSILAILWALVYKFNINKSKFLKKSYLYIGDLFNIQKKTFLYMIKFTYYVMFSLISIISYKMYFNVNLKNLFNIPFNLSNIGIEILLFIISIIAIIEVWFFISSSFIYFVLKKDMNSVMNSINWIVYDKKHPIYTGIIRPLGIVIIESIFYYGIILNILTTKYNISYLLSLFILSLIFALSKILTLKDMDQKILFGAWSFSMFFILGGLFGYTDNIIIVMIMYWLNISFWVFKR
ncbi:type II CAAX prenyl endopeptidase Rce1 family protein [Clostridium oceanicum]|uniref:Uncharacterized protein n=1 Tax=Clostridium oceanicum TaxID=1543 RepID=A0ABN1J8P6_9CLOT